MKIIIFWFKFHWNLFPRISPINNKYKIGSDIGLVLNGQQAIILKVFDQYQWFVLHL